MRTCVPFYPKTAGLSSKSATPESELFKLTIQGVFDIMPEIPVQMANLNMFSRQNIIFIQYLGRFASLLSFAIPLALCPVASSAASTPLAAANTPQIYLYTEGPDSYADGTPVLKGEIYALVWEGGGVFGGFNSDWTLVKSSDKIFTRYPTSEAEHCTDAAFTFDDDAKKGISAPGTIGLYLMDTRLETPVVNGDGSISFTTTVGIGNGIVNAFKQVASFKVTSLGGLDLAEYTESYDPVALTLADTTPANSVKPEIVDFYTDDTYAYIVLAEGPQALRVHSQGAFDPAQGWVSSNAVAPIPHAAENKVMVVRELDPNAESGFYKVEGMR